MATTALLDDPREKECTICHEQFTLPKILPCGHLLCRHCLISWLKMRDEPNCPLCRYPIVDGNLPPDQTFDDVTDSFPSHFFMGAIVEADRLLSKSHECCVCEDVVAVSLCINCGDMFCQACSKVHKKQSATRDHQVEDLASLTAVMLAAKRPATCPFHTNELSHAYCHTHNISICVLCATTDHRECQRVVKLENKAEESVAVLREVATTLKTGKKKLEGAIQEVDKNIKDLDKQTDSTLAEIEAMRQRLERAVQTCCHHLNEKTLSTSSDVRAKMLDGKTALVKQRGRFATHLQIVRHMEELSVPGSFSDMTSEMKRRVDSLDCRDEFLTSAIVNCKLILTIDPQVVTQIEQDLSQMDVVNTEDATKLPVLLFHDNHGQNIKLTNNGRTAERTDFRENGDGIVISREPMVVSRLYEVYIDTINKRWVETRIGVVTCSPDAFKLPSNSLSTNSTTVLSVRDIKGNMFGQKGLKQWSGLTEVSAETQVGLALDSSRSLHLYINGQHQGVITSRIPDPCYFMFDLYSRSTKVTGLPIRPLQAVGSQAE